MVIWSYKKLWGKKRAGRRGYDDIIRYLRTSIKQVKPNKKRPTIAHAIIGQHLKIWQRRNE